ncbi:MAG: 30S ribosomal protein S2 [Phycisphaerales bacterium]|nr:MAG: 30S ribosomal protein S2 [Phycisphaerales bacterium]
MASELVRQLIDSGIHFGHRASRWNPKMSPYIFGKRNTIHIIDIRETVKGLLRAKKFVAQVVARGADVLFIGTKRQARHQVQAQATRVGMPYVTERWLGGTLTNFRTIRSRLSRLEELEAAEKDGTALEYSKKMIATRTRELRKIRRNLDGIRQMDRLPGALVVIDVHRENNAVREARKLGIPTICLIDTDSDPDFADLPIPGNDDAIRAIDTVLKHLTDAIEVGLKGRTAPAPQAEPDPTTRLPTAGVGAHAHQQSAQDSGTDQYSAGSSSSDQPSDTPVYASQANAPDVGVSSPVASDRETE